MKQNSLPITVMKTRLPAAPLGSEEVNYHLNSVDYADDTIYFNVSHSITDASGYIPFIRSVLYQYLIRTHDETISPETVNLPDSELLPGEFYFPKLDYQVTKTDRYINAFLNVLNEAELSYSVSNYRTKNISCLELP